jgi:hypothetical protein
MRLSSGEPREFNALEVGHFLVLGKVEVIARH